ncbi:MAG: hypothetical protein C4523_01155 [Myxococcales bacterium]|nr:MAG: hypothetical protein C4523_01155 [Myxococcales bacterium]
MKKSKVVRIGLAALSLFFGSALLWGQPALATTLWWKIAPNSCAINVTGVDHSKSDNSDYYGALGVLAGAATPATVTAHCPVLLPQGVTMNKLRIRTFLANGLPSYSSVTVYLKRMSWSGGMSTLATSSMTSQGATSADADFSSSVDNESYMYTLTIYISKGSSANGTPDLGMIEIRYEQ